ncbi:hypothetical protein [Halomarina litorea]|uniref:hypothetical protein n=1 Tax=Halomarina litorea TaxID=2961595 RepID=UPI0020C2FCD0|nr:hypothetical protein [Halomarina sp. BCD28]
MAEDGDIRVLLVLDVILSAAFAGVVLWGMDFAGIAPWTTTNFVGATLAVALLTYVVVLRQ